MDNDRSIRRLTALENSASTARMLNLLAVHRQQAGNPELERAPFFNDRLLDRSLILKHRLRREEYSLFAQPQPNATKVLVPIDTTDLKVGARAVFVGQKDFDEVAASVFGDSLRQGTQDRRVLELMAGLPSLDPFLLREHLRANGIEPARAYFAISDADVARMFEFVREEVMALVKLSAGPQASHAYASRLVEKLLSSAPDSGFEPLKDTLKLSDKEYQDGVFSWRGFLYYKWVLSDLSKPVGRVMAQIAEIRARGPQTAETAEYIPAAKLRLERQISTAATGVQTMLDIYDDAYRALTKDSDPAAFRSFLLSAPEMFASLGEQLGALQHVVSYWSYRFPEGRPALIGPEELMDLLLGFEDSMAMIREEAGRGRAA